MKKNLLQIGLAVNTFLIGSLNAQLDTNLINKVALTSPISVVNCTLADGTSTQCYELKFYANVVNDEGPYCPKTINDVGGMGIYEPGNDGTNVGLAAIDSVLLNIIEADGFDIVQDNGDVNIGNPSGGGPPAPGESQCLQATKDDDLELVYLIPVTPKNLSTPNQITTVEQLGVSLDGIPFKGNPPGVIGGPGGMGPGNSVTMPALDACGGHHDPGGYYHWHMVANSTNEVLNDLNITAVSCTQFPQKNTEIMGFAMDGYPIYGQYETANELPTGLDGCNGHFGVTTDYPDGVYHYHAVKGEAPNIPPCLVGASANNGFTYSFHENKLGLNEFILNQSNTKVYPNPVIGSTFKILTSAKDIQLLNNMGSNVLTLQNTQSVSDGFIIDTHGLSSGIYNIVITQGKHQLNKKIIIN